MAHSTEVRPVILVPASPPTSPPTSSGVKELPNKLDGTTPGGETPLGITIGTTFPTSPQGYHHHYLLHDAGVGNRFLDWYFYEPTKARWLSTTVREYRFGSTSGGTNITLNNLGMGASGGLNGFATVGRPFVLVESYAMCSTAVAGAVTIRLLSSAGQTHEVIAFVAGQALRAQNNRNILIPAFSPVDVNEVWSCDAQGTVPAGMSAHFIFRMTEANP